MDQNQTLLQQVVKKHLLVFLGEKGLTSADANHKANLVKETLVPYTNQWLNTGSYNTVIDFEDKLAKVTNFTKIELVPLSLIEGDMNALSAWLREGIKAKDSAITSVQNVSSVKLQLESDEVPSTTYPTAPKIETLPLVQLTEEDIIGEWDIKTRSEYLSLESQAAGIGKRIHNNGTVVQLRNGIASMRPNEFTELKDGKMLLATNTAVYTTEEIETAFMTLQEMHREKESRLNYYKAKIKDDLNIRNRELYQERFDAQQALNDVYQEEMLEYSKELRALQQAHSQYQSILEKRRLELTNYVSKLRIVIPNSLQTIIDSLVPDKETEETV